MCLFAIAFFIHFVLFLARRHAFFQKRNIQISTARKALPLLILALVLALLSQIVPFLIFKENTLLNQFTFFHGNYSVNRVFTTLVITG